jgi:hypothetical protein
MSTTPFSPERQSSLEAIQAEMTMSFSQWSVSDFGPWECHICTLRNEDPLHLTCQTCGEERPQSKKNFSRGFNGAMMAGFSESMRRDIYGQGQLFVDNQCKVLERLQKTPEENSREINELQAALASEQREIEEMEMILMIKKQQIEQKEGKTVEELAGAAHKPGACKVSPVAMDWMGQHRMLTDWKELCHQRKAELNILRDSMSDR